MSIEPTIKGSFGPYHDGGRVSTTYRFAGEFEFEVLHESSGTRYSRYVVVEPEHWTVQLPHQCDEWEIGDAAQLAVFIAEAQAVAEWLSRPEEMEGDERTVDDGFGNVWVCCSREDCDLHVVRPGKVQCSKRPCEQAGE